MYFFVCTEFIAVNNCVYNCFFGSQVNRKNISTGPAVLAQPVELLFRGQSTRAPLARQVKRLLPVGLARTAVMMRRRFGQSSRASCVRGKGGYSSKGSCGRSTNGGHCFCFVFTNIKNFIQFCDLKNFKNFRTNVTHLHPAFACLHLSIQRD